MTTGHTDTKTVNVRRPVTRTMHNLLLKIEANRGMLCKQQMSQPEKNAARALNGRGLITWNGTFWLLTDAGREASEPPFNIGEYIDANTED